MIPARKDDDRTCSCGGRVIIIDSGTGSFLDDLSSGEETAISFTNYWSSDQVILEVPELLKVEAEKYYPWKEEPKKNFHQRFNQPFGRGRKSRRGG